METEEQAVIIDEYDAPLLDAMNDKVKLPSLRQIDEKGYMLPYKSEEGKSLV